MKTLYVSDLDGTLLNRDARLSDFTKQTLNELIRQGMLFTYATARSSTSSSVVTEGLEARLPIIVYNGGMTVYPETGEVFDENFFPARDQSVLEKMLEAFPQSFFVYACFDGRDHVSWMKGMQSEAMQRYLKQRKNDIRFREVASKEELFHGDIFYVTFMGDEASMQPVFETFNKWEQCNCILHKELYVKDLWCEIMPKAATKGNAVQKLKRRLGCEKVVVFGDHSNDISMFEIADEGYAVENAVRPLKSVASGVIGSNESDGVATWLARHAKI